MSKLPVGATLSRASILLSALSALCAVNAHAQSLEPTLAATRFPAYVCQTSATPPVPGCTFGPNCRDACVGEGSPSCKTLDAELTACCQAGQPTPPPMPNTGQAFTSYHTNYLACAQPASRQCVNGSSSSLPCTADAGCPGGTCGAPISALSIEPKWAWSANPTPMTTQAHPSRVSAFFDYWRRAPVSLQRSLTAPPTGEVDSALQPIRWCPAQPLSDWTAAQGSTVYCNDADARTLARSGVLAGDSTLRIPQCLLRGNGTGIAGPVAGNACGLLGENPAGCQVKRPDGTTAEIPLATGLENLTRPQVASLLDHLLTEQFTQLGAQHVASRRVDSIVDPVCAPRDPDYFRYGRLVSDTYTAWRQLTPTDFVLVMDVSGSMGWSFDSADRLTRAVAAAKSFVSMVLASNEVARIGVVFYSSTFGIKLPLTSVDATSIGLEDSTNPATIMGALNTLLTDPGAVGATSIGAGIYAAGWALCGNETTPDRFVPPATGFPGNLSSPSFLDCVNDGYLTGASPALVVLTDGKENTAPCLESGSFCSGSTLPLTALPEGTMACTIGFGVNADQTALANLAQATGGTNYQSTDDGAADAGNINTAFQQCFRKLNGWVPLSDPTTTIEMDGVLGAPDQTSVCGDRTLLVHGAFEPITTDLAFGEMHLITEDPEGNLVRAGATRRHVTSARESLAVDRPENGVWRTQAVRRVDRYINAVTTDAYVDMDGGVQMVRRQLHQLCPEPSSCRNVVYYEDGRRSSKGSVYYDALQEEIAQGLLGTVSFTTTEAQFRDAIASSRTVDLIVFAHQMNNAATALYDVNLRDRLCLTTTKAIYTENRTTTTIPAAGTLPASQVGTLVFCSGAITTTGTPDNYAQIRDLGQKKLLDGVLQLDTTLGYTRTSWHIAAYPFDEPSFELPPRILASELAATNNAEVRVTDDVVFVFGSVVAASLDRPVLATLAGTNPPARPRAALRATLSSQSDGLAPLEYVPVPVGTGGVIRPAFRVLPAFVPSTGFPDARATVEVTYPSISLQQAVTQYGCPTRASNGDVNTAAVSIHASDIPQTRLAPRPMFDNATGGDVAANNFMWTTRIADIPERSGTYVYKFNFDFTLPVPGGGSCTAHREEVATQYVGTPVDVGSSPTCAPKNPDVAPVINSTDVSVAMCGGSYVDVQLNVTSDAQDLTGVFVRGGAPYGGAAFAGNALITVPVGTTTIRWTANGPGGTTERLQNIVVTASADTSSTTCCPAGTRVVTGWDLPDLVVRLGTDSFCVLGKGGGDIINITAGDKPQYLYGGAANDNITVIGNGGFISGGTGNDAISTYLAGTAKLYGNDGNDDIHIYGSSTGDTYGGRGDDHILVFTGEPQRIFPGAGFDVVNGGFGNDQVFINGACELSALEVVDGGLGYDVLYTAVPENELVSRGIIVLGFEEIVYTQAYSHLAECP